MSLKPNYLEERICLSVLANSAENTQACYEAVEGHVVPGVLSENYEADEAAIGDMEKYQAAINNTLSVSLGAGDPSQSQMVARLSEVLQPQHVNQVLTGAGVSRALFRQDETVINGLVSPIDKIGYVNTATDPSGLGAPAAEALIGTATKLLENVGGSSIKYFPMKGLAHKEEHQVVAVACAKYDLHLESTGGIDLKNLEEIVQIAADTGVKKTIPHVYSSIVDRGTGDTRTEDAKTLLAMMKKTLNKRRADL